jgi:hypothetical protein
MKSGRGRETHCGDDGFDEPFGSLVSTAPWRSDMPPVVLRRHRRHNVRQETAGARGNLCPAQGIGGRATTPQLSGGRQSRRKP